MRYWTLAMSSPIDLGKAHGWGWQWSRQAIRMLTNAIESALCPYCGAGRWEPCLTKTGNETEFHISRVWQGHARLHEIGVRNGATDYIVTRPRRRYSEGPCTERTVDDGGNDA